MATHCSVLMCFRGMWWWCSILLVCFGGTWGRSIPLTLLWFTALKQFGGQRGIIRWELLWGYWRRDVFRFKWTVRKGCRIHTDGRSAWRDKNRLEWTYLLRHTKFVWKQRYYGNISLVHESDLTATSSLHFLLWYIFRVNSSTVSSVDW